MPRFIRSNLEGTKYVHITTHGIAKENIYQDNNEKKKIEKIILENEERFNINVIAYCIMNNHLHLLVKIENAEDLSKYMHKVNTTYAIYYNKKHNRNGYVYKDRFYSQVIKDEKHLISAIIYIHNNPVKAKICTMAKNYRFSSYAMFWKENKNKIVKIFDNKEHYEKMHNRNDIELQYMIDFEKISIEELNGILDKYLKFKNLNIEELKKDKESLYEICNIFKNNYRLSYREIENVTRVGRETIRRTLMKM